MIILSCKDICKSYGIRDVLKNITFSINEGDKVGIIGANGEGKSTLFKIITKELSQDSGEVFIDKNKTLGYLSQNLALNSEKNIYEEALSVFDELLNIESKLSSLEKRLLIMKNLLKIIQHFKIYILIKVDMCIKEKFQEY